MLEHLVNAAARLDRSRDGEVAVHLEVKFAGDLGAVCLRKFLLQMRQEAQRRLDDAVRFRRLRERAAKERGESLESGGGVRDVRVRDDKLRDALRHVVRDETRIDPDGFLLPRNGADRRGAREIFFTVHHMYLQDLYSAADGGKIYRSDTAIIAYFSRAGE